MKPLAEQVAADELERRRRDREIPPEVADLRRAGSISRGGVVLPKGVGRPAPKKGALFVLRLPAFYGEPAPKDGDSAYLTVDEVERCIEAILAAREKGLVDPKTASEELGELRKAKKHAKREGTAPTLIAFAEEAEDVERRAKTARKKKGARDRAKTSRKKNRRPKKRKR